MLGPSVKPGPGSQTALNGVACHLLLEGIETGYGLEGTGIGVQSPQGARYFSLHSIQTGPGAHPASCPMGTEVSFSGDKATGA
jgi:hypothetical protein